MLRVTVETGTTRARLRFEGRLTGEWVSEANAAWQAVAATRPASVAIDLSDVSAVDGGGRALLTDLYLAGGEFTVRGCVMRELVREIVEAAKAAGAEPVSAQRMSVQ